MSNQRVTPKKKLERLRWKAENRGLIDCDFWDKLSPEEQEFYANAIDKIYGGKGTRRFKREHDFFAKFNCDRETFDAEREESDYSLINAATPEDALIAYEEVIKKDEK